MHRANTHNSCTYLTSVQFFLEQVQLMYTPLFSRTEQEKNSIGVTNERVISSSENNRIDVTKEGSKFIEKNYRGYTEAICKTKFVNGLSPNS